jgi:hypothetical protein
MKKCDNEQSPAGPAKYLGNIADSLPGDHGGEQEDTYGKADSGSAGAQNTGQAFHFDIARRVFLLRTELDVLN